LLDGRDKQGTVDIAALSTETIEASDEKSCEMKKRLQVQFD